MWIIWVSRSEWNLKVVKKAFKDISAIDGHLVTLSQYALLICDAELNMFFFSSEVKFPYIFIASVCPVSANIYGYQSRWCCVREFSVSQWNVRKPIQRHWHRCVCGGLHEHDSIFDHSSIMNKLYPSSNYFDFDLLFAHSFWTKTYNKNSKKEMDRVRTQQKLNFMTTYVLIPYNHMRMPPNLYAWHWHIHTGMKRVSFYPAVCACMRLRINRYSVCAKACATRSILNSWYHWVERLNVCVFCITNQIHAS